MIKIREERRGFERGIKECERIKRRGDEYFWNEGRKVKG